MDNPVFVKLEAILKTSQRSPQWFGMAEQALNTIYLLGQQPDALCGEIIKTLTIKVFGKPLAPPKSAADTESEKDSEVASASGAGTMSRSGSQTSLPDTSQVPMQVDSELKPDDVGAFALAQLLFVVGHVALKHIVYLELVEREFKRRKDEKAKGKFKN